MTTAGNPANAASWSEWGLSCGGLRLVVRTTESRDSLIKAASTWLETRGDLLTTSAWPLLMIVAPEWFETRGFQATVRAAHWWGLLDQLFIWSTKLMLRHRTFEEVLQEWHVDA